jgi:cytidine deaminase
MSGENGVPGVAGVDWSRLRAAAIALTRHSYAPYSDVHVGAAGLTDDGRLVVGCNVENASLGLGLCAECGLVSALHASGGGSLVAVSVVAGDGKPLSPCGRCRQLLYEAGGGGLLVDTADGPVALVKLLPDPFGPKDVATRSGLTAPAGHPVPER